MNQNLWEQLSRDRDRERFQRRTRGARRDARRATRRRRRLASGLALAGLLVFTGAQAARDEAPPATRQVTVASGDTLWEIAADLDAGLADPRALVWMVREINELDHSALLPGQVLLVPADEAAVRRALRNPARFRETIRPVEQVVAYHVPPPGLL